MFIVKKKKKNGYVQFHANLGLKSIQVACLFLKHK